MMSCFTFRRSMINDFESYWQRKDFQFLVKTPPSCGDEEEPEVRKFIIEDCKFYNDVYLTLVLSDPASGTLKRSSSSKDTTTKDDQPPVGDTTDADMSLMSDEEMISEEDGQGSQRPSDASVNEKTQLPHCKSQYLVQLAYHEIWKQEEKALVSIDLTDKLKDIRPKLNNSSKSMLCNDRITR